MEEERRERAAAGEVKGRAVHAGPASVRRRAGAQRAWAETQETRREGLMRGPGGAGRGWCAADRWDRQGKITRKSKALNSKFKNYYFPGSKISQSFIGARSHYQEHNETTKTQKSNKYCSQKFEQNRSFQIFEEFYGSG
jgi:hypothetical protein